MTTGTIVFLVFVVIIILWSWLAFTASNQKKAQLIRQSDHEKLLQAKKSRVKRIRDEHEAKLTADWPFRHVRIPDWRNWFYLMISADSQRLAILAVRWRDEIIEEWEAVIAMGSIASVELQQDAKTIMRLETSAVTKRSGSLSRAVVGGVLFGGAGAVVGAASAGSKTSATTTSTSHTLKGPVYLVIGTTDMERPVHRVQMINRGEGESWLYRIRGVLAAESRGQEK